MYFQDLSPYSYTFQCNGDNIYNVGWLSNKYEFNKKGNISKLFLDNLKRILNIYVVNIMRGSHDCEFCEECHRCLYLDYNKKVYLGNGEIWIPNKNKNNNNIYVSPTLIWHYITEHNYIPPIEFVKACEEFDFELGWNPEEVIEK